MRRTVFAAGVCLVFVLASSLDCKHHPRGSSAGFELRVDTGNKAAYKDMNGKIWVPDRDSGQAGYGFTRSYGDMVDRGWSAQIQGTKEPRIYQTEHWGVERFVADVPDGRYTVILHFAETWDGIDKQGPRVFDVKIQGQEVLKDFDILKTGLMDDPEDHGAEHSAVC